MFRQQPGKREQESEVRPSNFGLGFGSEEKEEKVATIYDEAYKSGKEEFWGYVEERYRHHALHAEKGAPFIFGTPEDNEFIQNASPMLQAYLQKNPDFASSVPNATERDNPLGTKDTSPAMLALSTEKIEEINLELYLPKTLQEMFKAYGLDTLKLNAYWVGEGEDRMPVFFYHGSSGNDKKKTREKERKLIQRIILLCYQHLDFKGKKIPLLGDIQDNPFKVIGSENDDQDPYLASQDGHMVFNDGDNGEEKDPAGTPADILDNPKGGFGLLRVIYVAYPDGVRVKQRGDVEIDPSTQKAIWNGINFEILNQREKEALIDFGAKMQCYIFAGPRQSYEFRLVSDIKGKVKPGKIYIDNNAEQKLVYQMIGLSGQLVSGEISREQLGGLAPGKITREQLEAYKSKILAGVRQNGHVDCDVFQHGLNSQLLENYPLPSSKNLKNFVTDKKAGDGDHEPLVKKHGNWILIADGGMSLKGPKALCDITERYYDTAFNTVDGKKQLKPEVRRAANKYSEKFYQILVQRLAKISFAQPDAVPEIDEAALKNVDKKALDPKKVEKGYELALLSDEKPVNGKIYLSANGLTYTVLDPQGKIQTGDLTSIGIKPDELSGRLNDRELKNQVLAITKKAGHTTPNDIPPRSVKTNKEYLADFRDALIKLKINPDAPDDKMFEEFNFKKSSHMRRLGVAIDKFLIVQATDKENENVKELRTAFEDSMEEFLKSKEFANGYHKYVNKPDQKARENDAALFINSSEHAKAVQAAKESKLEPEAERELFRKAHETYKKNCKDEFAKGFKHPPADKVTREYVKSVVRHCNQKTPGSSGRAPCNTFNRDIIALESLGGYSMMAGSTNETNETMGVRLRFGKCAQFTQAVIERSPGEKLFMGVTETSTKELELRKVDKNAPMAKDLYAKTVVELEGFYLGARHALQNRKEAAHDHVSRSEVGGKAEPATPKQSVIIHTSFHQPAAASPRLPAVQQPKSGVIDKQFEAYQASKVFGR